MTRIVNVLAMAGAGQRFIDAGFRTPKPLISVLGKPLFLHACKSLPPADLWIFICQQKHLEDSNLKAIIENEFPSSLIVTVSRITGGQAETCLLAEPHLFPDDQVTFGACDSFFEVSKEKIKLCLNKTDLLVLTTTPSPMMLADPRAYGWVKLDQKNNVEVIKCKEPASLNPAEDEVIIGSFVFRRADIFLQAVQKLINSSYKIRDEFYMDSVAEQMLKEGKAIKSIKTTGFVSLGTPQEIETWQQNYD